MHKKFEEAMQSAKWEIQHPQLDLSYIHNKLPVRPNLNTSQKSLPPRLMQLARESGIKYISVSDEREEDPDDSYEHGHFTVEMYYKDDTNCSFLVELPESTFEVQTQRRRDHDITPHSGFTVAGVKHPPLLPPNKKRKVANLKQMYFHAGSSYRTDDVDILEWGTKSYFSSVELTEYADTSSAFPTCSGLDNALLEQLHYEELIVSTLERWIELGLSHSLSNELADIMAGKVSHPRPPKCANHLIGETRSTPLKHTRFNHDRYRLDWHAAMAFNQSFTGWARRIILDSPTYWNTNMQNASKERYTKYVYLIEDDNVVDDWYQNYIWPEKRAIPVNKQLCPESVTQHFWPLLHFCYSISNQNQTDGQGFPRHHIRALKEATKNDNFIVTDEPHFDPLDAYRLCDSDTPVDFNKQVNSGTWWASLFHQISGLRKLGDELFELEESLKKLKGKLNNGTKESKNEQENNTASSVEN